LQMGRKPGKGLQPNARAMAWGGGGKEKETSADKKTRAERKKCMLTRRRKEVVKELSISKNHVHFSRGSAETSKRT